MQQLNKLTQTQILNKNGNSNPNRFRRFSKFMALYGGVFLFLELFTVHTWYNKYLPCFDHQREDPDFHPLRPTNVTPASSILTLQSEKATAQKFTIKYDTKTLFISINFRKSDHTHHHVCRLQ